MIVYIEKELTAKISSNDIIKSYDLVSNLRGKFKVSGDVTRCMVHYFAICATIEFIRQYIAYALNIHVLCVCLILPIDGAQGP
jgi:hypothetical protein